MSNIELNYWVESYDYSAKSARIWVKVPYIPASSATKIRMYYGNEMLQRYRVLKEGESCE